MSSFCSHQQNGPEDSLISSLCNEAAKIVESHDLSMLLLVVYNLSFVFGENEQLYFFHNKNVDDLF